MSLYEVNEASTLIQQAAHEDAEIIFGAVIDETMKDDIRITVIATGFKREERTSKVAPSLDVRDEVISVRPPMPRTSKPAPEPRIVDPNKPRPKEAPKQRPVRDMGQVGVEEEEEYDIPTFIRRQTDLDH